MKNLLFDLCKLSGVSGDEGEVARYCADYIKKYTDNVYVDFNNNLTAVVGNLSADKTVMLDAHLDRIGFIVTEVDERGFLRVDKVGGVDLRTVLDAPVVIYGKRTLFGTVCCMPPHLSDGNEDKAVTIDRVIIQPEEITDENGKSIIPEIVSAGDCVTFYSEPVELLGDRVSCAALDNRAGVAAVLRAVDYISDLEINARVIVSLTSQEETYAAGAKTAAFLYEPDECICVDVSFAAQPGISDQYASVKLGEGAMLCISPNLNREMFNALRGVCEENNIKYQLEVCNGRTGTNADHIAVSRSGVKTAVVSVPEKNMHTQAEIVSLADIESTAALIREYLRRR